MEWCIFVDFSVSNGVKQGAIINPILFSVYLDASLVKLCEAGVDCCIAGCRTALAVLVRLYMRMIWYC